MSEVLGRIRWSVPAEDRSVSMHYRAALTVRLMPAISLVGGCRNFSAADRRRWVLSGGCRATIGWTTGTFALLLRNELTAKRENQERKRRDASRHIHRVFRGLPQC